MKKLFVIVILIFSAEFSNAQNTDIPETVRSAFAGVWQYSTKFQTNTVKIQFEAGKDYALFTDIGSGEAPPKTYRAIVKDNLLIIPAIQDQNDEIEMEVVKGRLHLRVTPARWGENSAPAHKPEPKHSVFKRIKLR